MYRHSLKSPNRIMRHIAVVFCALLAAFHESEAGAGLVIGGFGATNSVEGVTKDGVCMGGDSTPSLPQTPVGYFGWTSQYVDNQVVLCGGADVDYHEDCYCLDPGASNWEKCGKTQFPFRYGDSIVFNGEMVIMGGYNLNQGWLPFVYKRSSGNDKPELMRDWEMPRKIYDFCAVAMDDKRIMVLGKVSKILESNPVFQMFFVKVETYLESSTRTTWTSWTPRPTLGLRE